MKGAVGWRFQLAAMLIFVTALVVVHPSVEAGMNDDWSFIRTARDLASTGHLRYNGWSAPLIGFQAYWGALFIKLLGFSFLAVRASSWTLTLLFIPVLWELFRTLGLSHIQAFFGLLLFLLSPLNLPNLSTFMTDMPAFLLFAAALLCALKTWGAERDRTCILWTIAMTACAILSGSVRQIYWLAGICFLVVLGLTRLRMWGGRLLVLVCLALTLSVGAAASRWLAAQPYVPADSTVEILRALPWTEIASSSGSYMARFATGAAVLVIPFSLLFAASARRRLPVLLQLLVLAASAIVISFMPKPLPWLGNTLTQSGVLQVHAVSAGDKPEFLSPLMIMLIGWFGIASAMYGLPLARRTVPRRFIALVAPFLLGYLAVLAIRGPAFGVYDRYLIPAVFVISTTALSAYARTTPGVSKAAWVAGTIMALYALATTHDYFAEARAKLQATREVMRAGHSRDAILSGFEFDCWTQTEQNGHINNELVKTPVGGYQQADDCDGPDETQMWWRSMTPDVHASYVVSLTPLNGLKASEFTPIEYWRWLPLRRSRIYVQRASSPLSCKADIDR